MKGLLGLGLATGLVLTGAVGAVASPTQPPSGDPTSERSLQASDALPNPLAEKQQALRKEALDLVLTGQRKIETINGSQVVKVGRKAAPLTARQRATLRAGGTVQARTVDQYVELGREKTDKIFVVLAEFGNERHPNYPDQDTDPQTPGPSTFNGPLHNAIPAPDRSKDNSTIWQPDYSADHYRKLYFGQGAGVESLKTYYEKQSSGRYSVDGTVTDWVKVRYNEARYGRSNGYPCAAAVCSNTWALLTDGLTQWVADQKAAGKSDAQIKAMVSSYDQQDRYDYDADGNFNESDGYIDHFQIVHAGGDQADADPFQGEDAIWSHRWYVNQAGTGRTGPATNRRGGTPVGNTGLWVGDYTIQPENGGLPVFAHEYAHDLGLPDLYDTAGGRGNPMEFWSLMAQSRLSAASDQGIGTRPGDLGAWEKMQLGWLDYEIAVAGQTRTYDLGPHEYNSEKPQAVVTVLPPKSVETLLPAPPQGTRQWWSGQGDDLDNSLTRQLTLPAGSASLTFQAAWNIEDCNLEACDYGYVEVDDGTGWKAVAGSITTAAEGNGIDGQSGGYRPATFDLSAYAGKSIGLRFRYATDGAAQGADPTKASGLFVDDITVVAGGTTLLSDGAENGANGWTARGFTAVGGSFTTRYPQYYLASHRRYVSYDRYLRTGPYDFGYGASLPDKVDHFPYQDGLQVTYWDKRYTDNNVSVHPGNGQILTVDAHPRPLYRIDGLPWRDRVQLYDATFGTQKADSFTLHVNGQPSYVRGQAAQPLFDDTRSYFDPAIPSAGVKVAGAGVTMRVLSQGDSTMRIRVGVSAGTTLSARSTLAKARAAG